MQAGKQVKKQIGHEYAPSHQIDLNENVYIKHHEAGNKKPAAGMFR